MSPFRPFPALAAALLLTAAAPALAPAKAEVVATPLAAPDIFTTAAADTGLPQDLWKGTSPELARQILPLLAQKPLSPAAQSLAYRLLATGAPAPDGAGGDQDLAAARAQALLALGDAAGVNRLLDRVADMRLSEPLSRVAAEAALYGANEDRACRVAEALGPGRDQAYWLRLRAFCQLRAGDADTAQLTFDLAQTTQRDPVFARLMGAKLAGGANPGKPSSRNGLEFALSRSLGLEVTPPALSVTSAPPPAIDAALTEDLFAAAAGPAAGRAEAQGRILLLVALGAPLDAGRRAAVAGFTLDSKASPARLALLDMASRAGRKAETALLALAICADAGPKGLTLADRARLVRALMEVGLADDARRLAAEGLGLP